MFSSGVFNYINLLDKAADGAWARHEAISNNIANQDELQAYVDRVRDRSMSSGQTINVETALLPGFGVDDVTALHYDDLAALCIETAWDMQLKVGGTMRHTLERVIYNV